MLGRDIPGESIRKVVYPHQSTFNLIPHVDEFEDGYTKEEMKMLNEGRKIMGIGDPVSLVLAYAYQYFVHIASLLVPTSKSPLV